MSQNSVILPITGVFSGLQEQGYINDALDTLRTKFSGSSAPSSPEVFQWWADTSGTPYVLKMWDGASWVTVGQLNAAAHTWGSPIPPGYLNGLFAANDGSLPNTVLDIGAGTAADTTNTVSMVNPTTFTKAISGAWAAGSGSNGMGNGLTATLNTWYHTFEIINAGLVDFYFDTSLSAANKPAGTTAFRRVPGASILLDASVHIIPFTVIGGNGVRDVLWKAVREDVTATNPGAGPNTYAMSVPPGIQVDASLVFGFQNLDTGTATTIFIYSPDQTTISNAAAASNIVNAAAAANTMYGEKHVRTDTSRQIKFASGGTNSNMTLRIITQGWREFF